MADRPILYTLLGLNRAGKLLHVAVLFAATAGIAWWLVVRPQSRFHDEDEMLFRAARHGDVAGIDRSLDAGAQINVQAPVDGKTAIFRAAVFGHADAVRELLKRGADVERRGNDGRTVLEVVASARAEEHDPARAKALDAVASALRSVQP
jgi:hypothetical protein